MTQLDDTTNDTTEQVTTESDRRSMLRKMAIGGAGAAAGVALLKSGTASAADGDAVFIGTANVGTLPTTLDVTPPAAPTATGPSALSVGGYVPTTQVLPAAIGGYGDATIVNGVHGSTLAPTGYGVVAANLATAAVAPAATNKALAISSTGAHVQFLAGPQVGPAPGTHVAGELYVDSENTLWYTVPAPTTAAPTAVRFVKLAGTPTAGSFTSIAPQRAYDSRIAAYPSNGLLARNTSRVVSVANGHNAAGAVTLQNAVPVGATAVEINLTAASPTEANFLSVAAGDAASTATSLLNWNLGVTQIANSITVPVTNREIRVFCGDQAGSTHFIVDVFGYYL